MESLNKKARGCPRGITEKILELQRELEEAKKNLKDRYGHVARLETISGSVVSLEPTAEYISSFIERSEVTVDGDYDCHAFLAFRAKETEEDTALITLMNESGFEAADMPFELCLTNAGPHVRFCCRIKLKNMLSIARSEDGEVLLCVF